MSRQFRLVHVGVAAAMAAATVSAIGLVQSVGAAGGGTPSVLVPIVPCRLVDTRAGGSNVGPRATPLGATEVVTFSVWGTNGNCTIPSDATGIATNATAVNPTADSYITIFPSDASPRPTASNLNVVAGGAPTPNQVTVGLSAGGMISAYNNGGTVDLIIDIVGYYTKTEDAAALIAASESRSADAIAAVDARNNLQKVLSFNVLNLTTTGTTARVGANYGITFADNASSAIYLNYVVPPDQTPGTTMTLQVTWRTPSTSCTVNLAPNALYVSRPGSPGLPGGSSGLTSVGSNSRSAPAAANNDSIAEFTIDRPGSGGLQPGDVVGASFFRQMSDACAGDVYISGVQVVYR